MRTIIEGARRTVGFTEEDVWKTNGEIMGGKTKIARVVLSTSSRIARWNRPERSSSRRTRRQ